MFKIGSSPKVFADPWVRIIRLLLANTRLSVRTEGATSRSFKTTTGTPQGDSLSPLLFTIYLESALRDLRKCYTGDIEEASYADDVDFVSRDVTALQHLLENAPMELGKWVLSVNVNKTEITEIKREDDTTHERWRHTNKLGSLLGDAEDVLRRKTLANSAMAKLKKGWLRAKGLGVGIRCKLYNAFVKPILLYNAGTLDVPSTIY
ncbi:uncharacterized protein LOC115229293 [Octopus sinensis]|uniref:Uncharacterized protein LOC115229293 n=1 Tax=Octopus sinensis TaxID=2607531 RepID=A0A6P7U3P1_9MOLL|nr:uncharacterized protein LOC115229293 [Octopus sinensis]